MKKRIEEKKDIIKILKPIFKDSGVLFCYLFGSFANNNNISKSDVDLGVYLNEKKHSDFFDKRLELISQFSKELKKDVDVIILNSASPFLKYVILKEGELIFEKERSKRIDFELKSINEYFDFRPILEKYNQRLLV